MRGISRGVVRIRDSFSSGGEFKADYNEYGYPQFVCGKMAICS